MLMDRVVTVFVYFNFNYNCKFCNSQVFHCPLALDFVFDGFDFIRGYQIWQIHS
jgi:hypothetical protein